MVPCKAFGHTAGRDARRDCIECKLLRKKTAKGKAMQARAAARHYRRNRKQILARVAKYRRRNREQIRAQKAARYQRNQKQIREQAAARYQRPKVKAAKKAAVAAYRRRPEVKTRRLWVLHTRRGWVDARKRRLGCTVCGTRKGRLELHHRDPATKVDTVSHMIGTHAPIAAIRAEILKCNVLCTLHHRVAHRAQQRESA